MRWVGGFKAQLVVGVAGVVVLTVAALGVTLLLNRRSAETREARRASFFRNQLVASRIEANTERLVAASRGYLLTANAGSLENIGRAEDQLDQAVAQLIRVPGAPELSAHLEGLQAAVADYRVAFQRLDAQAHATTDREAFARLVEDELLPRRTRLSAQVEALIEYMERLLAEERASARVAAAVQARVLAGVAGGGVLLAVLLAWALTRRLDALYESERVAKRLAEHAVQARQELLAVVAHDLRNPLNALMLRAAVLSRATKVEEAKKSGEVIGAVARRMEHLIGSLLDAATIEAGRFTVARVPCAVEQIVSGTLAVFGGLAAQRSIRLSRAIEGGDLVVAGDRERLIQVLSNLVGNSLKFTPAEGEISVRVRPVDGKARFEVRDTGPGIAPEHLPFVFDRYWRASAHTQPGAGLGLYISKGIVEAHGGRIWVESGTGQGCVFLFEVPLAPTEAPGAGQQPGPGVTAG